jgi:dihydroxy-acid dehydratase
MMSDVGSEPPLRSAAWFGGDDLAGFLHRVSLKATGLSRQSFGNRPVVGICNSWSEVVSCNYHFRGLADAVKRGVAAAGGIPLEFPTISLGENLMKPTAMLYRNLMSMDVEESIRAYPFDAVVLLAGCDKTIPAQLMGAASADVPAVMVTGGPANAAVFEGRRLGVGTDLWRFADALRAGSMTAEEFEALETASVPSVGHCNEMGTASTMAVVAEALGMSLPGSAAIPATDARRYAAAELAGHRAVELAKTRLRPSDVLTAGAFENALTVLASIGGSTNAIVHLLALAGRAGVDLCLDDFDEMSKRTPLLANVRPSGEHLLDDFFYAGGVPRLMRELLPLLDGSVLTVTGRAIKDNIASATESGGDVIASLDDPVGPPGALAVLRGNLAPRGAVLKVSAASPSLLRHEGPALVFESIHDVAAQIDSGVEVTRDTVLVLRGAGPVGGPGMPEWGQLPIPSRLLASGIADLVRVSDARMSGSAFGTTVLHVTPEAAVGGPLAAVRTGDRIRLDVARRRLDLLVPREDVELRLSQRPPHEKPRRGWASLYADHVLQADEGCDFAFLRGRERDDNPDRLPLGLLSGWVGGW